MILDIVLMVVLVGFALVGLALGFFRSLIGFIATMLTFVGVYFLAGIIANALLSTDAFANLIFGRLYPRLVNSIPQSWTAPGSSVIEQGGIVAALLLPFRAPLENNPLVGVAGGFTTHQATVALLSYAVFVTIVALILFTVIRSLMIIPVHFIKKIAKKRRKRIKPLSRLGGFFVQGAKGIVYAICFFMMFGFIFPAAPPLTRAIDNGVIAKPLFAAITNANARFLTNDRDALLLRILIIPQMLQHIRDEGVCSNPGCDNQTDGGLDFCEDCNTCNTPDCYNPSHGDDYCPICQEAATIGATGISGFKEGGSSGINTS